MKDYEESLAELGFFIKQEILSSTEVSTLRLEVESARHSIEAKRRGESVYGIRNLLNLLPAVRLFSESDCIRSLVQPILGKDAKVVKGIYFDKNMDTNWKVAWHQDLTITVRKRINTEGFTAWSIKSGIVNVQPPASVMEKILTLRIYLDDSDETNGALRVIPGSHRQGRLNDSQITQLKESTSPIMCEVPCGGVLVMRPLLLHSSSESQHPLHRRVIHLEFASERLPGELEWFGS